MYLYTNACTATSTDNGAMDYIYTAYVHVQAKMNVCVIFTASANASYYLKYCYMFKYGASQIFYVYCIILN